MKSKWQLFSSIFQLIIGIIAIIAFIIVGVNGEKVVKWVVTLILSIAFVVLGIMGIIDYNSKR